MVIAGVGVVERCVMVFVLQVVVAVLVDDGLVFVCRRCVLFVVRWSGCALLLVCLIDVAVVILLLLLMLVVVVAACVLSFVAVFFFWHVYLMLLLRAVVGCGRYLLLVFE